LLENNRCFSKTILNINKNQIFNIEILEEEKNINNFERKKRKIEEEDKIMSKITITISLKKMTNLK